MINSESIKGSSSEKKVKKTDMVLIQGTGVSKFLPANSKSQKRVHRVHAERLVAEGKAKIVAESKGKELKARRG